MDATKIPADPSCLIYVGNLSYKVTKEEILNHFQDYNPVNVKKIQREEKCYAFLELLTANDASQAVSKLHKTYLLGRRLVLRPFIEGFLLKDSSAAEEEASVEKTVAEELWYENQIFISSLPVQTKADDLQRLFEDFGPEKIKICNRPDHCFAFITLRSQEDVHLAVSKMNGSIFRGGSIQCRLSEDPRSLKGISGSRDSFATMPGLERVPHPGEHSQEESQDAFGSGKNKIFVDNLPRNATQEDLMSLFKSYDPISVWIQQQGHMSFAVVEVKTHQNLLLALEEVNETRFKGSRLDLVNLCNRNSRLIKMENTSDLPPMPALELVSGINGVNGEDGQTDEENTKAPILIPVEMRETFLNQMLKDCFGNQDWLSDIMDTSGEVSLLVTNAYPRAPYFWALKMSRDLYDSLTDLGRIMDKEAQPAKHCKVQRGLRCMAQCCLTGVDQEPWSRCWVCDVFGDFAVVFFLDYGLTGVLPSTSLRSLDDDHYWTMPPLAQPFLLPVGFDASDLLRTVIHGRICGARSREPHILNFKISQEEDSW